MNEPEKGTAGLWRFGNQAGGESQEYVEDCPVCCRPNVIHVEIDEGGDVRLWAEGE